MLKVFYIASFINPVCLHNCFIDNAGYVITSKGVSESAGKIRDLCSRFGISAIAIGNGTAGRETESFIRGLGLSNEISIVMVNESGASIS